MIDYEKIKQAYELVDKTNYYLCISIIRENYDDDVPLRIAATLTGNGKSCTFDNLDSLIAKLKELVASDSKYKIGDEVWFESPVRRVNNNFIESISTDDKGRTIYHFGNPGYGAIYEIDAYPTKKDLICAQIQYWQSMMSACILDEKKPQFEGASNG